jgi:DNA-binding NarL/FixJ family response regulator
VIRVFIVAASPLARAGLQNLLSDRGVEVIGSTSEISSLVTSLANADLEAEVDAILMEATGEHIESTIDSLSRSDLAREIPVVVLAGHSSPRWAAEALRGGVRAVLPNDVSPNQLWMTLQAVAAGLLVLHPAEIEALVPAAIPASQSLTELPEPLTPREREVLQMLAAGLANKEIAARLNISDHTAKFHVGSILGKLSASTRAEAVTQGIRRGLVLL